jgi:hypothetical protein
VSAQRARETQRERERERERGEREREREREREMSAEYELNEIDAAETSLHGSLGSRLSLFARELKSRRSSWHSSGALRLPHSCCYYGSFVIHPNGRYAYI